MINATSLFESDVFDVKSLVSEVLKTCMVYSCLETSDYCFSQVNISIVKSEHVKVSVNKSWNDAVQLFHRARDKANRVTGMSCIVIVGEMLLQDK